MLYRLATPGACPSKHFPMCLFTQAGIQLLPPSGRSFWRWRWVLIDNFGHGTFGGRQEALMLLNVRQHENPFMLGDCSQRGILDLDPSHLAEPDELLAVDAKFFRDRKYA